MIKLQHQLPKTTRQALHPPSGISWKLAVAVIFFFYADDPR